MDSKALSELKEIAKQNDFKPNTPVAKVAALYNEVKTTHGLNKHIPKAVLNRMAELSAEKMSRMKRQYEKLVEENNTLKEEIKLMRQTLSDYEKRHQNMVNYKATYWLSQAKGLAEQAPMSRRMLNILALFMGTYEAYDKRLRKLLKIHEEYIRNSIILLEQANQENL